MNKERKLKVLLINPPFHRLKGFGHTYYPIGLGYLCSVANKLGMDARIYNADAADMSEKVNHSENYNEKIRSHKKYIDALSDGGHYVWKEIDDVIRSCRPDVVGITVMTAKYASAMKVSQIAKSVNERIRVVWGGPHPTICTKEVIGEPSVDFVVSGEGEKTLEELLAQLKRGSDDFGKIRGLAYKKNGIAQVNAPRELVQSLDELTPPDRENMVYPERYFADSFSNMITSRGCPFLCGYCSAKSIWTRKTRYRSIDSVISEIRGIKSKFGSKNFYFWDDSFTVNRNRAIDICNRLIGESLHISWGCTTRVDLLDEEVLHLMKKAGCDYISIGVESGSEHILKIIEKDITVQQVKKAVEMIKKSKIAFEAFFIIGFPDETKPDIEKTFQLMKEMEGGTVCFSVFTPYPGSAQFDTAKRYGLIPEKINWSDYSHQSSENYFVRDVSKNEFRGYVDKFSREVDAKNAKDLNINRLFLRGLREFPNLIKRPGLVFHKGKTLLGIFRRRLFTYDSK